MSTLEATQGDCEGCGLPYNTSDSRNCTECGSHEDCCTCDVRQSDITISYTFVDVVRALRASGRLVNGERYKNVQHAMDDVQNSDTIHDGIVKELIDAYDHDVEYHRVFDNE